MTLLRKYRSGMRVEVDSGTLYVRTGEAVLENTDSTKWNFRRNASDVTLSSDNLDVGAMVEGTYYVFLKAGTAATTAPVIFSTDSNAPSAIGTAPYRKIGWFYNAAGGSLAITYAGDIMEFGTECNYLGAALAATALISGTDWATVSGMDIPFVSNGRPVEFHFASIFDESASTSNFRVKMVIDGSDYKEAQVDTSQSGNGGSVALLLRQLLAAGNHSVQVQVSANGGDTMELRKPALTVKEL